MKFIRLNVFISIFIMLLLTVESHTSGMTYQSNEYYYSLVIPPDWEEITKQILDETSERIASLTGTEKINYETGFRDGKRARLRPD